MTDEELKNEFTEDELKTAKEVALALNPPDDAWTQWVMGDG